MTTPDPTEYLLARCAEDEDVARAASPRPPWRVHEAVVGVDTARVRVLAGIKAKRAVVEQHREEPCPFGSGDLTGNCETCAPRQQGESNPLQRYAEDYPCPTLRALLQEFASRKDFPDEWRTT